ncbi:hypothetical protein [Streptomyces griseorubiginosus]|uniref:hypothetical protein n=1 Tax=Streptomyces griseorubiginosus TaxID=67304 RepID=UPI00114035FE|nr:hypothetical protein [Streptomyces griseorubiginosus]
MIHEVEDIELELRRLSGGSSPQEAPPVMCAFDVDTSGSVEGYATRVRSVLAAVFTLAISESFDGDDLPAAGFPEWFTAVSGASAGLVPDFARFGKERYIAAVKGGSGGGWQLQEWIYQFDPDSEFRGWAWWDLVQPASHRVRIWVDTWGESFFACDELRWLMYTAGGTEVVGPTLVNKSDWLSLRAGRG